MPLYRIFIRTIEIESWSGIESDAFVLKVVNAMTSDFNILSMDSATLVVAVLVGCFCLVAIWSSITRRSPDEVLPAIGPKAKGVFLAVRYRVHGAEDTAPQTGHMMTLALNRVSFVSNVSARKGQTIDFDLGSVVGFPERGAHASAVVASCRVIGRGPDTYLITVNLRKLSPDIRQPLAAFISQLAAPGRLSHA